MNLVVRLEIGNRSRLLYLRIQESFTKIDNNLEKFPAILLIKPSWLPTAFSSCRIQPDTDKWTPGKIVVSSFRGIPKELNINILSYGRHSGSIFYKSFGQL